MAQTRLTEFYQDNGLPTERRHLDGQWSGIDIVHASMKAYIANGHNCDFENFYEAFDLKDL